jgi:hypothetical protein
MYVTVPMAILILSFGSIAQLSPSYKSVMLGFHGNILEIRVENRVEIIAKSICLNRLDSSVAGIL